MTDLAKAIAFATNCLKWTGVSIGQKGLRTILRDGGSVRYFEPDDATHLEKVLQEFLGKHYFIQINRGKTGLFQWQVIVGLQDKSTKGTPFDNAQAEGEDLWDAIFDACVGAAGMFT
jgi:hypothetical protein